MKSLMRKGQNNTEEPEHIAETAGSMHQHRLGTLTFNSASKQDLVNTINRWMVGQQRTDSTNEPDFQANESNQESVQTQTLENTPTSSNRNPRGFCIGYVNPHVYNLSQEHTEVHEFLTHCDLLCIDGLGTSLALRLSYGLFDRTPVHRVVALNLFDALISQLNTRSTAVMIGINDSELKKSAENINKLNSAFNIIDITDGFGSHEQYTQFLISHQAVQWVLIGAGTPKSETIALLARKYCPNAIVFHMGAGTIKVYAGSKRRAPQWISNCGLEWAHRMMFEPHTRERYTRGAWQFITHLIANKHTTKIIKPRKQP